MRDAERYKHFTGFRSTVYWIPGPPRPRRGLHGIRYPTPGAFALEMPGLPTYNRYSDNRRRSKGFFAMPIYEFTCDACGKDFEKLFRSMTARRPPVCPHCASRNVHKKFSSFAAAGGDARKGRGGAASCATCSSGSCATCGH